MVQAHEPASSAAISGGDLVPGATPEGSFDAIGVLPGSGEGARRALASSTTSGPGAKIAIARMPTLTWGRTTWRKACRREAPSVMALISIVVALGLTAVIGQVFPLNLFVLNMVVAMGPEHATICAAAGMSREDVHRALCSIAGLKVSDMKRGGMLLRAVREGRRTRPRRETDSLHCGGLSRRRGSRRSTAHRSPSRAD